MLSHKKRRVIFTTLFFIIVYAALAFSFIYIFSIKSGNDYNSDVSSKVYNKEEIIKAKNNIDKNTNLNEGAKDKIKSDKFVHLEEQIIKMCSDNNGEWSIFIKDLKTGEALSINNKKMVSASLIKLYIMAKVYEDIRDNKISRNNDVNNMLKKMITISHNDSSNKLVELLGDGSHKNGMKVINNYAKSKGYKNTEQQRDMLDYRPKPIPEENYTSVEDCGKILENIYNQKCVGTEFDKDMMGLLLAQERNSKLPLLLPKGTKIAHKTGELTHVENDVGIVFTPHTNYILCVISNNLVDTAKARSLISQISKVTYDLITEVK